MQKRKSHLVSAGAIAACLVLTVLLPAEAAEGARSGLSVCAGVIIPSLFPFLVLSALCSALGLTGTVIRLAAPLFRALRISPNAAAPMLLGFLGGYPIGADTLAALVRDGTLSPAEAERMLPYCNNTGPAFIIGAAGSAVFGSARLGLGLYLCHILAALTLALLSEKNTCTQTAPPPPIPAGGFAECFPGCVRSAAASVLNISAFVVFFSMLTALLNAVGLYPALIAAFARASGAELQFSRALLTGLLELGSGITAMRGLAATPCNLALCAFLLGFGGLSVHCQTLSVLSGTKIRCARHFAGRILHGALSALYAYLLFTLLQI